MPSLFYLNDEIRDLLAQLKAAYQQRAELKARGEDTTEINETILELRCKIRDSLLDGRFELIEPIVTSAGISSSAASSSPLGEPG